MPPTVTIHSEGILRNLRIVKRLAQEQGIRVSVVTKGLVRYEPLVRLLIENGADSICDAYVQNLKHYEAFDAEKWMIRLPLISEAAEVARYADVSLNSELPTIGRLGEEALKLGKTHKVVVMMELGERREGVLPGAVLPLCRACLDLPGVELYGIGGMVSCYSGVVPDSVNMGLLARTVRETESALGIKLPVVSGGSTVNCHLLQKHALPKEINHLRIGEAVLIGNIACYDETIQGGSGDNFTLTAEIIEIQDKPSQPAGSRAPGETPADADPRFPDRGIRKRALIGVGKQDVDVHALFPHDPGVVILEGTSDCFIADITDSAAAYKIGDKVSFSMNYYSMLPAMSSDYIEKILG
jgi:predicted amino acid racemase